MGKSFPLAETSTSMGVKTFWYGGIVRGHGVGSFSGCLSVSASQPIALLCSLYTSVLTSTARKRNEDENITSQRYRGSSRLPCNGLQCVPQAIEIEPGASFTSQLLLEDIVVRFSDLITTTLDVQM